MDLNDKKASCCAEPKPARPKSWVFQPLTLLSAALALLFFGSYVWSPLVPFRETVLDFFTIMALPVLLGFFLGGVMEASVPGEYISKYLSRKNPSTVFYAVGLGFLMSACNHGILALSMALHRKGASGAAVVSFLLASPWANLPVTFLLVGFFGWKGFLIVSLALLIALVTGLVFQVLEKKGWVEANAHSVEVTADFSILRDLKEKLRNFRFTKAGFFAWIVKVGAGIKMLAGMVLFWILLGVFLSALAAAFVPTHWFDRFLGPDFAGLLVTLAFATVLEICSEGTSPLAFTIYQKTGAFGNAFAFLMAGVVTDYTEIGLIWKNLGRRSALWMLALSLPQVIVISLILNQLF